MINLGELKGKFEIKITEKIIFFLCATVNFVLGLGLIVSAILVKLGILYNKNMIFKIIFDSIFILDLGMLYFFILQFINFGYLHVYFFLALSVGFFASFSFFKELIRKNDVKK